MEAKDLYLLGDEAPGDVDEIRARSEMWGTDGVA